MRKSSVIIVLLVFGLSFLGACTPQYLSGSMPKGVAKMSYTYSLGQNPDSIDCEVAIEVKPEFRLTIVGGEKCRLISTESDNVNSIKINNMEGEAISLPQGWYRIKTNPCQWCWVNDQNQYKCLEVSDLLCQ